MSMNLYCDELEISQLPSAISYLILSQREGRNKPDGGWKGVVHRYKLWLRREYEASFNNPYLMGELTREEAQADETEFYKQKLKQIDDAIAKHGKLHFGVM